MTFVDFVIRRETGSAYAQRYLEQEQRRAIEALKLRKITDSQANAFHEPIVEAAPTHTDMDGVSTVLQEPAAAINFEAMRAAMIRPQSDKALPIEAVKTDIIKHLRLPTCSVLIIEGPTGCGKTTMVPQFIMDDCIEREEEFNIIVTQPRRIAAISVSQRVCQQRKLTLGQLIGYQIGMDKTKVSLDTRLCFCTTGVLLQRLISTKDISRYSHIVIDEIHERGVDTDFVVMVIRKLMWEKPCNTKLILMSATFETQKLADYFSLRSNDPEVPSVIPAVVKITQRPAKILSFTLETIRDIDLPAKDDFKMHEACLIPQLYDVAAHIIKNLHMTEQMNRMDRGAVLVFLPGLNEINELFHRLSLINQEDPSAKFVILPLHSSINVEEQKKVFIPVSRTERKVILATNIAESSITVPDVHYVIDFCLTKNLVVDKETNLPTLKLEWATKANCRQREGRTGRVCDGRVFRLVYSMFYHQLPDYPEPEIKRCTLELCVLRTKVFNMGAPKRLLALCLDPPRLEDITKAVLKLKRLGALTVRFEREEGTPLLDEEDDEADGHLTTLGNAMSCLPIDVNLSKLIIIGYILGLADDAIIMAACLSVESLFSKPYGRDLDTYKSKLAWADRSMCDLFAARNAFLMYRQHSLRTRGRTGHMEEWATSNFIQLRHAREIEGLIQEIKSRLEGRNICTESAPNIFIPDDEKELLLKVMIAGAFYPNYFFRRRLEEQNVLRSLTSHNPLNSVIIGGLPQNEGVLYAKQIQGILSKCSDKCVIDFEGSRAIVSFVSEENILKETMRRHLSLSDERVEVDELTRRLRDTNVKNSVYIACKMKKSGYPMNIFPLSQEEAKRRMAQLNEEKAKRTGFSRLRSDRFIVTPFEKEATIGLPKSLLARERLRVRISHVVECGRFFVQHESEETERNLRLIREAIAKYKALHLKTPVLGMSVLVNINAEDPQNEDPDLKQWFRGVITGSLKENKKVNVLLVDSGLSVLVGHPDILVLDPESAYDQFPVLLSAAQAFECELMEIRPAKYRNIHETWSPEATQAFKQLLDEDVNHLFFEIDIYSIMNNIARVRLYSCSSDLKTVPKKDINELLILRGWADWEEESLISTQQHMIRAQNPNYEVVSDAEAFGVPMSCLPNVVPRKSLTLKGPSSPLEVDFVSPNFLNHQQSISIERNSVNCITLEPDLKCSNDRLLVAASVAMSNNQNKIIARETSMMPYIPGFASLMTLLFTPFAELRAFDDKLYFGALCGLGADNKNRSFDPKYDIDIKFDAVITSKDMTELNVVRYLMSSFLNNYEEATAETILFGGKVLYEKQEMIRDGILKLLQRRRMNMPKLNIRGVTSFKWGFSDKSLLVDPGTDTFNTTFRFIGIHKDMRDFIQVASDELEMLNMALTHQVMTRSLNCPVCGVFLYTLNELETHLKTKQHLEQEKMLDRQRSDDTRDERDSVCNSKATESVFFVDDDDTSTVMDVDS